MFFDFVIKLGMELNKDCRLIFRLSKAPALTSPSNCNLLISFGLTRFKKSLMDLNGPLLILSWTILETASYPTALIPPKA